jgi:hypothetical protein
MKTTDFNSKKTSKLISENLDKMFGAKVDLGKYSREQLENYRNIIRTRIFQVEESAGYNDLLKKETYQKDKAMLELLNTRIKEMLGEQMQKLRDKMSQLSEAKKGTRPPKTKITAKGPKKPDEDGDGIPDWVPGEKDGGKPKKGAAPKKGVNPFAKKDEKVKEGAKPDFLDLNKNGNKTEPMKKAAKDSRVKEGAKHPKDCDCKECCGMSEASNFANTSTAIQKSGKSKASADAIAASVGRKKLGQAEMTRRSVAGKKKTNESFRHNVRFVNESIGFLLSENEEVKAKAITSAGDIVNDFTSWMQRVGTFQTKAMIELSDTIRAEFGEQEAESFKQAVGPALTATLEVLTQQREAISSAVAVLAGEAAPMEPMGADPMAGGDELGGDMAGDELGGLDGTDPDALNPELGGDEFGASDAGSSSREMRESREQRRARKLAESHSIMSKLSR